MIWSVFVTFAIMCVGFGQVVYHACSQLGHLVLQHLTALDNQNSFISFTPLCSVAHTCLRCLSSSRSSLRSGPRKCTARIDSKTKTYRQTLWCGRTSHRWQACHNFCPMWCGALWSHKDSLQWLIALKCKPYSTLQLQIFAESFKLSLWLLQVWVQFSPHTQYENINGPVVI